jgi:type VI secretion system protein ImpA
MFLMLENKMKKQIDIDALLAPVPGDNPAGEDQRYAQVYDEIREARKEIITYDPEGKPNVEKKADWNKVVALSIDAITQKTKDLQIAVWLTEALLMTENIEGFNVGLKIINGLLEKYWENLYPPIEEDDLEFRASPLEFMNEKISTVIKSIPVTDPKVTEGISYQQWQESRTVGYDADIVDKYGDVDNSKKQRRDELIAEGKMTADQVDGVLSKCPVSFYELNAKHLMASREELNRLNQLADEKFGSHAPRLSDLGTVIEDFQRVILKLLEDRGGQAPGKESSRQEDAPAASAENESGEDTDSLSIPESTAQAGGSPVKMTVFSEPGSNEDFLWQAALKTMKTSGIKNGLNQLLAASNSAPSARGKNRYRLLMAKLCLKAGRPDLSRPIIEELYALMEELHLDRWESPIWISEVIDAYYQCLTRGEPSDENLGKAKMLFQKLCTLDVTKAIPYGQ